VFLAIICNQGLWKYGYSPSLF